MSGDLEPGSVLCEITVIVSIDHRSVSAAITHRMISTLYIPAPHHPSTPSGCHTSGLCYKLHSYLTLPSRVNWNCAFIYVYLSGLDTFQYSVIYNISATAGLSSVSVEYPVYTSGRNNFCWCSLELVAQLFRASLPGLCPSECPWFELRFDQRALNRPISRPIFAFIHQNNHLSYPYINLAGWFVPVRVNNTGIGNNRFYWWEAKLILSFNWVAFSYSVMT